MSDLRFVSVNQNVYDTIQSKYSSLIGADNISKSGLKDIEKELAKDGVLDADEKKLLDALSKGEHIQITCNGDVTKTMFIEPNTVDFDARLAAGDASKRINKGDSIKYTDGNLINLSDKAMVPEQKVGRGTNNEVKKQYKTDGEAQSAFDASKAKLLDVNNWEATADSGADKVKTSAKFTLSNADGSPVSPPRNPKVGDWVKIHLPGSPNTDWVKIEGITDTPGKLEIKVRCDANNSSSHFFNNATTNTFILEKKGNDVVFSVKGRNEVSNNNPLDYGKDKMGNWTGMQDDQWKDLGKGMLGKDGAKTASWAEQNPN